MGLLAVFALTVLVAFKQVKVVEVQEEERSGFRVEVRHALGGPRTERAEG